MVNLEEEDEEEEEEEEEEKEEHSILSIAYYQTFFNVDTMEVAARLLRGLVPFRINFLESVKDNPDLWGPFWVSATLVFLLAAVGNFARYINSLIKPDSVFSYDFAKLPYGALVVFLYMTIVPLALWGIMAWTDDFGVGLVQLYCLYGYAMSIFIPASIACAAPFNAVKWVAVSIAFAVSVLHLLLSLGPVLAKRRVLQIVLLIVMVALHAGLCLGFIFYWFDYKTLFKKT